MNPAPPVTRFNLLVKIFKINYLILQFIGFKKIHKHFKFLNKAKSQFKS